MESFSSRQNFAATAGGEAEAPKGTDAWNEAAWGLIEM